VKNDGGRQFDSVFPYRVYGAELIKLLQLEGRPLMPPSTAQAANQSTARKVLFLK